MSRAQTVTVPRWRFYAVALGMLVFAVLLVWRIAGLQVLPHADRGFVFLQGQGQARTLRTETISAYRGVITDRNGEPLAVSTPVQSLWANPQLLNTATDSQFQTLAAELDWELADLKSRLQRFAAREFMYLQRHLPPHDAERILALDVPGVHSQREYRRYYPAGEVAAHLVGVTDIDERGQEGLELAYDAWLAGERGARQVLRDLRGRTIREVQLLQAARPGRNLALSIDLRLQYLAYRELSEAVRTHAAAAGSLVMLDAATGEVLAMVNYPSYNPNDRTNLRGAALRNRALTDLFEPGSTVKPLVVMAALETGEFSPATRYDTSPGYLRLGRNAVTDPSNYGVLDLTGVIAKSSQVGMSKLSLELDPDLMREMYYRLGFGQGTGTGFPGEGVGMLPAFSNWQPIQRANLAYGYGLNVTVVQLAQAYGVLANQGVKRPVSLLRLEQPAPGEPVVDRMLVSTMMDMLQTAVGPDSTGHRARTADYPVAGKTGTVHKAIPGGYAEDRYVASFAGMAPADQPRIVTVVVIDDPRGGQYFGGQVAAPVFSRVSEAALRLLEEPPRQAAENIAELRRRQGRPES